MKPATSTVLSVARVLALLALQPAAAAPSAARPNILFIIADDQSPFDLKAYDPAAAAHTPVLDRLAAEGMVLDAAYHMGSFYGAVCVPSRHMLMTGRTLWHLPIGPKSRPAGARRCPDDIADWTIPAVFNRAGYDTMRTCKAENCYEDASRKFTVRHDATKRAGTAAGGSAWHADRVLDFLADRERTGDRDPFLVYLGFSHPHDTRDGTPELLARYGAVNHADRDSLPPASDRQPPLPDNWLPAHPFPLRRPGQRDETAVSGVWERRDPVTIRNEKGRECACSENIDTQIGRVLERIAALGELENTWIFYTSDHGIAVGRHGLMGKQNLYEHSWRVPLIVKGPGVKAGSRAPGNVYLLDVLATLCAIAGIEAPATNEGTSFLPVLTGRTPAVREVLYGVYSGDGAPGTRAVRRGDWKLVEIEMPDLGTRRTQLFNLRDNPLELLEEHAAAAVREASGVAPGATQRNLAADPPHADTLATMRRLLVEEMRRHDDPDRFGDLPGQDGAAAPAGHALPAEHGVVSRLPGEPLGYFGWPSIARMDDGTLLVVSSGLRSDHVCPHGKTVLNVSRDDGRSWSEPRVIQDSLIDDRDAGIVSLGGKVLLASWFRSDTRRYVNEKWLSAAERASWGPVLAGWTDALVEPLLGAWTMTTDDGGTTWSEPARAPVSAPHGPIRLANGDLLYLGKPYGTWQEMGTGQIAAARSADRGRTWKVVGRVPVAPQTDAANYHEPHVVELPSGRLVAAIRVQDAGEKKLAAAGMPSFTIVQTESDDGGATWSTPRWLGFKGSPPHLLRHSSGALVMSYGFRDEPYGQRMAISRDDGASWEADWILRADGLDGDLGYPATVELPDGRLLTVCYQKAAKGEKCSLLWSKWRLPDAQGP